MSFTKQLRSWFFRSGAPINPNVSGDLKDHFADRGAPSQGNSFEPLTASVPFFTESSDRAKASTGGAIENEVGIVAVTTDAKAKANTSGLESDRTLVVHAAQLPTPDVASQVVDDFTGEVLDITPDATTTRNNNVFTLAGAFVTWLISRLLPSGGTANQVLEKVDGTDYNVQWVTPAAATSALVVEEEGVTVGTTTSTINFVGDGVTAVDAGGNETTVTVTNTPALIVQDTDVTVGTTTATLNFEGTAVTSTVDEGGGKTTVTIDSTPPTGSITATTWNTISMSGIATVDFISGDATLDYTLENITGLLNYYILESTHRTVIANFTLGGRVRSRSGGFPTDPSTLTNLEILIDVSSIGDVSADMYGHANVYQTAGYIDATKYVGTYLLANASTVPANNLKMGFPTRLTTTSNDYGFTMQGSITYKID